jgi:predicted N-acetyltransferase YhbS
MRIDKFPATMELTLLADRPEALPIIAKWYFEEWGYLSESKSVKDVESGLERYLNTDKIPLMVIASDNTDILGAATLRYNNMAMYREKVHWLGGVYVPEVHRSKGIASLIIKRVISSAEALGVTTLHLLTEDLTGGLYRNLGWRPVEQVNYLKHDFLVMELSLVG